MAAWQTQAGIELMSSAQTGMKCQLDYLISHSNQDQNSVYRREAFLCFKEARKLGGVKGAFNEGLCYEQGIGTRSNLEKVNRQKY